MAISKSYTRGILPSTESANLRVAQAVWFGRNATPGELEPRTILMRRFLIRVFLKIWAPKVLHGTLAAGTDYGVYALASSVLGKRYRNVAVRDSLYECINGLILEWTPATPLPYIFLQWPSVVSFPV